MEEEVETIEDFWTQRASYGDDRVWKNWEFRNHLELVKESEAWDGGQQPGKKLGFKHRSAEGAGDTTGRARFEDSASEEGTPAARE